MARMMETHWIHDRSVSKNSPFTFSLIESWFHGICQHVVCMCIMGGGTTLKVLIPKKLCTLWLSLRLSLTSLPVLPLMSYTAFLSPLTGVQQFLPCHCQLFVAWYELFPHNWLVHSCMLIMMCSYRIVLNFWLYSTFETQNDYSTIKIICWFFIHFTATATPSGKLPLFASLSEVVVIKKIFQYFNNC